MENSKYKADDLIFTTVSAIDAQTFQNLIRHVATLTKALDGEEPLSYLAWILQHAFGFTKLNSELQAHNLLRQLNFPHGPQFLALAQQVQFVLRPKSRSDEYLPPHDVYLALDRQTSEIAAIAGFVPDDRDVGKHQNLSEIDPDWIGFFGGHNVARHLRGKGIGPLMIAHRAVQIQKYVDEQRRRTGSVYSFLTNPKSGELLVKVGGFVHVGTWYIKHFGQDQHVFRREFEPVKRDDTA